MKMYAFSVLSFLVLSGQAFAQAPCTWTGPNGYKGEPSSSLVATCGTSVTPPPVNPPIPPVQSGCDASQSSSPIAGKTLKRQCTVSMNVYPSGGSYSGVAQDLGVVLSGKWPTYNYSGYSPTYTIQSGYYISLAFTPTSSGGVQFSANGSYGDGGTISVSKQPGSLSQGSPGFVCGMSRNITNGIYISTEGGVCTVSGNTNYYLNLADVDANGNFLCHNGAYGSCASSPVSYTIYTQ